MTLTLSETSLSIYQSLLSSITHKIIVESLLQEHQTRIQYGPVQPAPASNPSIKQESRTGTPMTEILIRQEYVDQPGKDIFGSEKVSDSSHLFECRNCGRKVAGNRFAQHIDRCLGGRQRK